jgi:lipoprotein-anchoring transpeptidase ErfK/SrfK
MRQINENSKLAAKAKLVLAVLVLAAARMSAQEQQVPAERRIIISLADRKLALIENGQLSRIYPVAVGKASTPSPTGTFTIATRVTDPTYYHPGQVVEPGPMNPLGTRWIGLNQKGYGIHGTNAPNSIGKAASHGCIRMAKADVEALFEIVRPGDVVDIRGERDDETAQIFGGEPVILASAGSDTTTAVDGGSSAAR